MSWVHPWVHVLESLRKGIIYACLQLFVWFDSGSGHFREILLELYPIVSFLYS